MTRLTWTKEALLKEASKYETRSEFAKANKGAYNSAIRQDLLDELGLPKSKWTKEKVVAEARRFSTLNEFRHGNPGAYEAVQKKGWLHLIELQRNVRFPKGPD